MTAPDNPPLRLVKALKVLRIIYLLFLLPLAFFSLFGLFIFFSVETRLIDWLYFFHHSLLFASMVTAIISTGPLIRRRKPKTAFILYLVPVGLIASLVLYESLQ